MEREQFHLSFRTPRQSHQWLCLGVSERGTLSKTDPISTEVAQLILKNAHQCDGCCLGPENTLS
jgi:hypothetical protein